MSKTLRLLMPQWQGGNNPPYAFGARLLHWLAPEKGDALEEEVPVRPFDGKPLEAENGVNGRSELLEQTKRTMEIIRRHEPDRIIVFGGDCLVSQAPFAYLAEKYGEKLGILWLDAHPDISTPAMHCNEHAMVLGNLMGGGDPAFAALVPVHVMPEKVMYGGIHDETPEEAKVLAELPVRKASPQELKNDSSPILRWIEEESIEKLAIHLDLDVLDPALFRSLLLANPEGCSIDAARGEMTFGQIAGIIKDAASAASVAGFAVAEHLPWDAINLKSFLEELPVWE